MRITARSGSFNQNKYGEGALAHRPESDNHSSEAADTNCVTAGARGFAIIVDSIVQTFRQGVSALVTKVCSDWKTRTPLLVALAVVLVARP